MQNKNIDSLMSEKANSYMADNSYMSNDFASIKAQLPTSPTTLLKPSSKPFYFNLNAILGLIAVVTVVTLLFVKNKKSSNKNNSSAPIVSNSMLNTISKDTLLVDTPVVVNEIPKDPKIAPKKWVYKMQINFAGKTETKLPPKEIIDIEKIAKEETTKKEYIGSKEKSKIVIQNFLNQIASPTQLFTINNQEPHHIICKDGTTLKIAPNTFIDLHKKVVKGNVALEIKEAYSYTDIIANNLHTVSNGNLLQSGGMVYINATQNRQQLDIDIQNPIQVEMPTTNKRDSMQLFNLDKNNWVANGQWQGGGQLLTYYETLNNNKVLKNRPEPKFKSEKWRNRKEGNLKNMTLSQSLQKQNATFTIDTIPTNQQSFLNQESIIKTILCNPSLIITKNGKKVALFKFSEHVGESFSELKMIATLQFQGQFDTIIIKKASPTIPVNLDFETIKKFNEKLEDGVYYNFYQLQNGKFIIEDSTYCSIGYMQKLNLNSSLNNFVFNDPNSLFDSLGNVLFKTKYGDSLNYNFNIRNFGWINCDKFLNEKSKIKFVIEQKNKIELQTSSLIFPQIKSMMSGNSEKNNIYFNNIPEDKLVTYIAFQYQNDKVLTCIQQFTTSKDIAKASEFIELTPAQVKAKLDALGNVKE